MQRKVLAALLALSAPAAAQPGTAATLPDWLAGMWHMQDGIAWAEEMWMSPRDGIMLGVGRSGAGPQVQSWEAMRIVAKPDGRISFFAQPKGAPASEFPMSAISAETIEFTNTAHDYPQRIRYWRQGQLLMAEISKIDGSNAQRWNFRPMALGQ